MYRRIVAYHFLLVFVLCTFQVGLTIHYCCGKKIDTKLFIGNGIASCGMAENSRENCDASPHIQKKCCENVVFKLEFKKSFNHNLIKAYDAGQTNYVAVCLPRLIYTVLENNSPSLFFIKPPPDLSETKESLSRLQVFRI